MANKPRLTEEIDPILGTCNWISKVVHLYVERSVAGVRVQVPLGTRILIVAKHRYNSLHPQ